MKILITNSHSANRGDEAAQRSMIYSLKKYLPDTHFTVLSADPNSIDLQEDVDVLDFFFMRHIFLIQYIMWVIFRRMGVSTKMFLPKNHLKILHKFAEADLILSAPGGPYIGDLYTSHEIIHIYHICLAKLLGKTTVIYAPSMGPFKLKFRNIIRKFVLNKVDLITLREELSENYLKELNLNHPPIFVTADSALQSDIIPNSKIIESMMLKEGLSLPVNENEHLIGITPTGVWWNYPNSSNPEHDQNEYNRLIAEIADYMIQKFNATIVFFPQLYGSDHDTPLICDIVSLMRFKQHTRVLSEQYNSDEQQMLISKMDFFVGNRYHSIIFASKMNVPSVCIAYEHKAVGFMKLIGLEKYVVDIKDANKKSLISKINEAWLERNNIKKILNENNKIAMEQSLLSTKFTIALLEYTRDESINKKENFMDFLKSQGIH